MNRSDAFKRAFEIKQANFAAKKAEYESQMQRLEEENPELKAVKTELSALGAKVALTALSGDAAALGTLRSKTEELSRKKQSIIENSGIKPPMPECAKCGDTGYVKGRICECVKELAKSITVGCLSQSLPLGECRFENFSLDYYPAEASQGASPKKRMTRVFKLCREYALNFNPKTSQSLLFMGSSGLGKTHLSLAIVYELLQKGFDVIYGSAYNLFSSMESEHFNRRSDLSYNHAVECDLLVIDDLGSEFVSPYTQTLLYNIINTRLLASRPTVISTNLTMAEIENRYTPRVSSRLLGSYNANKFLGNDIRQLKSK